MLKPLLHVHDIKGVPVANTDAPAARPLEL